MIARWTGTAALAAGLLAGLASAVGTAQAATPWSLGQWDESWVGEPGDGGLSTVGVDRRGEAGVISFGEGVGSTDALFFSDLHERTHGRIAPWSSPATVARGSLARLNERGNLLVVNQEQAGDGTLTVSAQRRRGGALSAPHHLFTLVGARGIEGAGLALALSDQDEGVVLATSSTHVVGWSLTRAGAWTDPVELDRGARFSQPRLAINDAGDVIAVWRRATADARTLVSRRRGPGFRWQSRRGLTAASGVSSIDVAMTPIGTALAVWWGTSGRVTGAALPLTGRAWRRTVLNRAGERLSADGLGVDGAGRGLAVLTDFSGAVLDATYTPVAGWRRVGGKRPGRGCTVLSTTVLGTALCTYFRGGTGSRAGVFATRRSATGRWSAPERIAPLPENFGEMLNGLNAAGDAVAAWVTGHSNGAISGQTAYYGRRTPTRLKSLSLPSGRRERSASAVCLRVAAFQIGSHTTRPALIQVRRPGARRPLAGAIVILHHGANRLPLPGALRRVMTGRGRYEISVRTGARSFGPAAERRTTLEITG